MRKTPSTRAAAKLATAAMYAALSLHASPGHADQNLPLAVVEQRLADDPRLLAKVAARNGMTAARLMGEARGEVLKKVREYLAEQEAATPTFARESVPAGRDIPLAVVRQNLLDDPDLLAKVAAKNGMTAARFMGQEEGRILQMVRVYLAEREAARSAPTTQPARPQPAPDTTAVAVRP
jgi:hypothetical protein